MKTSLSFASVLFVATSMLVGPSVTGCSSSSSGGLDGTYKGTYSGDDSGPVTMTVSGTNVDVVATVGGKQYPASTSVSSSGDLSVGLGVGGGVVVTFTGTLANGKGSGTWKSSVSTSGKWSVAK